MYKATMDEVIVSKKQVDIPSPIQISWIVMFGGQYLILAPQFQLSQFRFKIVRLYFFSVLFFK